MRLPNGSAHLTCFAIALTYLYATHANALISLPEREHIQEIVWIVEAVSFVSVVLIFWFVWYLGKRGMAEKKSKQDK